MSYQSLLGLYDDTNLATVNNLVVNSTSIIVNGYTFTYPVGSDTLVTLNATQTLNNKTLNNVVLSGTPSLLFSSLSPSMPIKTDAGYNMVSGAIILTSDVSGTLPIGNGGTNSNTALTNDRLMVSRSGSIQAQTGIGDSFNMDSTVDTIGISTGSLQMAGGLSIAKSLFVNLNARVAKLTCADSTNQIRFDNGSPAFATLNCNIPANNRIYTIVDMGVDALVIMSNSTVGQSINNNLDCTGTLTSSGGLSVTSGIVSTGTSTINLSADAVATTINIGTGAAVKTINIGNATSTTATNISAGSGLLTLSSSSYVSIPSLLTLNSGFQRQRINNLTTGTHTLDTTYNIINCDDKGGSITLNLPVSFFNGTEFIIYRLYKTGANTVTITPNATLPDTINGVAGSITLANAGDSYRLIDNAWGNWIKN